jgi:dipeptidyl aminopeptidase/acylaminoacyl peptidase
MHKIVPIMLRLFLCMILIVLLHSTTALSQNVTLENIMSSPFPSNLISATNHNRIAWIFNDKGIRNIWIADGPKYKAQKVTPYTKDDGQELGGLCFSPDGSIIVYVRGGYANRAGEYPNPTSNPAGAKQQLWAIKVEGREPWCLGDGLQPKVSPKGDQVAFRFKGKIFVAPLDGSSPAKPLFEARGNNGSHCWSPDGNKIAFVSEREDHSFIGIYDLTLKEIIWISPSVDMDTNPLWSPDGKNIAFIRLAGGPRAQSLGLDMKIPFSIWLADSETGEAQKIWGTNDGGGFAQYYPAQPLMWGANNRLIFYSEHEGRMHLYSVSTKGGEAVCLTPGDYEVENAALTPDGNAIILNSNKDDIDRRHLWSVPVTGGDAKQLTKGKGIEWSPVAAATGKQIVLLCSTFQQPAAPAVIPISGGNAKLIAPEAIPAQFPLKALVEPQQVIFKSADGLDIHGQLFLPTQAKAGDNRPAVIFMHGGPIRQMLLGWHYGDYYHNAYAMNQYLASKGYVVLSVNYRSGIGYGRAFRNAPHQGPRGASEYQDIIAAGIYLQYRPEVNPHKIGLWGGSYGGYLTALGLARNSDIFAAGVDLHGVHDWSLRAKRRHGGGWAISTEKLYRMAYDSSPVAGAAFWSSPVLFIHGDDDRNVDFVQTTDLIQRLCKYGKAHIETLIFPDEVHGFLLHKSWIEAYSAAADFFDRFLQKDNK